MNPISAIFIVGSSVGSCKIFLKFLLIFISYSDSQGSYKSTGTKIFKKFDQKVGQKDSLRISYIFEPTLIEFFENFGTSRFVRPFEIKIKRNFEKIFKTIPYDLVQFRGKSNFSKYILEEGNPKKILHDALFSKRRCKLTVHLFYLFYIIINLDPFGKFFGGWFYLFKVSKLSAGFGINLKWNYP